jgi:hypothetical protein
VNTHNLVEKGGTFIEYQQNIPIKMKNMFSIPYTTEGAKKKKSVSMTY